MENTPQPIQQNQAQPQGNGLDPKIVNAAKAIRQVESRGNFQEKGASGEYGAYQFTPDTWNGASKKYLGQNVDLFSATPDQQNEVAYKRIADWENQGYDLGQVASMWNAGEGRPNAYEENFRGVNKQGVSYDTPAYAKKVAETYHQIKGTTPPQQQIPQPSQTPNIDNHLFGENIDKIAPWLIGGAAAIPAAVLAAPELLAGVGAAALGTAGEVAGGAGLAGTAAEAASPGILGKIAGGIKNKISGILSPSGIGSVIAGEGIGKAAGLLTGSGSSISPSDGSTIPNQEQNLQEEISQLEASLPNAQSNQRKISEAVQTMLGSTAAGSKYLMTPDGHEAAMTLGTYGAAPVMGPNGTANSLSAIDTMQENDKQLARGINSALDVEGKTATTNDVLKQAYEDAEANNPQATPEQMDIIKGHIARNLERESSSADKYGHVKLSKMNKYRKQHGASSRFDLNRTTEQRAAHKSLNSAYKKTILRNSEHKDLIHATLREETKIHRAIKALQLMHGKKIPKAEEGLLHMLLKESVKFAGAKVGDKIGGPVGAVIGYLFTRKLTNSVDKRLAKQLFERPGVEKFMEEIEKKNPTVYNLLVKKLTENGIKLPTLLLPAPKEGSPKESHYIPIELGEAMQIEKRAQKINTEKQKELLGLPAPKPGTISGETMRLPTSSRDLSNMERQAQKINRSSSRIKTVHGLLKMAQKKDKKMKEKEREKQLKKEFLNEPYMNESKLPVIRAGKKPRSKTSGLPVIKA